MTSSPKPELYMTLADLLKTFGMTMDELIPDLEASKIIPTGAPRGGYWTDVRFPKSEVERWMFITGRKPVVEETKH